MTALANSVLLTQYLEKTNDGTTNNRNLLRDNLANLYNADANNFFSHQALA